MTCVMRLFHFTRALHFIQYIFYSYTCLFDLKYFVKCLMKYFHSLAPQLDMLLKASLLSSYLLCKRVEGGGVREERETREKR